MTVATDDEAPIELSKALRRISSKCHSFRGRTFGSQITWDVADFGVNEHPPLIVGGLSEDRTGVCCSQPVMSAIGKPTSVLTKPPNHRLTRDVLRPAQARVAPVFGFKTGGTRGDSKNWWLAPIHSPLGSPPPRRLFIILQSAVRLLAPRSRTSTSGTQPCRPDVRRTRQLRTITVRWDLAVNQVCVAAPLLIHCSLDDEVCLARVWKQASTRDISAFDQKP